MTHTAECKPLTDEQRKLLYQMAELIEFRPDEFKMDSWTDSEWIQEGQANTFIVNGKEHVCGTSACLAGWACLVGGVVQPLIDDDGYIKIPSSIQHKNVKGGDFENGYGWHFENGYGWHAAPLMGVDPDHVPFYDYDLDADPQAAAEMLRHAADCGWEYAEEWRNRPEQVERFGSAAGWGPINKD